QLYFIYKCEAILKSALEDTELSKEALHKSKLYNDRKEIVENAASSKPSGKTESKKIESKPKTRDVTFGLYLEGKKVDEIAKERGLTVGTIQSHFIPFLKNGKLKITDLMTKDRADIITHCITNTEAATVSEVRQVLGDDFGFGEIRLVWASLETDE
ncbi:MAG: helix-turn-helix domain-containing protein, partial [Bacteroidales bacterium]|nr:helix-turn-helix domain-containing protein [Bacteroidales bacterium]